MHRVILFSDVAYFSEYPKKDQSRIQGWGYCHKGFQWAKKGGDYHL